MNQSNREQLRAIMRFHNLSPETVAGMCMVKVQTCRNWLYSEDKANYRGMSDGHLKLLKCLIEKQEGFTINYPLTNKKG